MDNLSMPYGVIIEPSGPISSCPMCESTDILNVRTGDIVNMVVIQDTLCRGCSHRLMRRITPAENWVA